MTARVDAPRLTMIQVPAERIINLERENDRLKEENAVLKERIKKLELNSAALTPEVTK